MWLRIHTEVYTEVKQLGSPGWPMWIRRIGIHDCYCARLFETTFETSVWRSSRGKPGCGTHMWAAFFGNRQPHLPNVERNRPPQNTFWLSQKIIAHPTTPSARHRGNLQRASPNLWVSVFRSLFIVFHCIVHCHCPVRLFSLY